VRNCTAAMGDNMEYGKEKVGKKRKGLKGRIVFRERKK